MHACMLNNLNICVGVGLYCINMIQDHEFAFQLEMGEVDYNKLNLEQFLLLLPWL